MGNSAAAGFTLIELMTVLAILTILLSIAIPAYTEQIRKANRAEAMEALMRVASAQERNLFTFGRYSSNLTGPRTGNALTSGLNLKDSTQESPEDNTYYSLSLNTDPGGLGYSASAAPQGSQVTDACGTLMLDHTGDRSASGRGSNNCW